MNNALSLSIALAAIASGCALLNQTVTNAAADLPAIPGMPGIARHAVVTGLTQVDPAAYGGWDGACPGCDVDAATVRAALTAYGFGSVSYLTNSLATRYRFTAECVRQAAPLKAGDLLLVFNSSHGGQVTDVSGDENGGKDSTVCLWDGQLVDDLLWDMLCQVPSGVRVVFISDSCNSGSVYRGPRDYSGVVRARATRSPGTLKCSLIMMAGCPDGKASYGGDGGGEWTNALFKKTNPAALSWVRWFETARAKMPRNQSPVFTEVGASFKEGEALK